MVWAPHLLLSPLLLLPPRLQRMRLMSALLLMLPLYASLIRLTGFLKFGAVVLIVAELVAVVAICVAEVLPRRLQGDASSRDTSLRVGVGAGEVVGIDLRHYSSNACKVAVPPSTWVWWVLSYSGGRRCWMMSSYRWSQGPSREVTKLRRSRYRSFL